MPACSARAPAGARGGTLQFQARPWQAGRPCALKLKLQQECSRSVLLLTATPPPTLLPCSPMFILPVFKGPNAFENFMVQCQLPLVLFTTLEEYKQ